MSEFNWEIGSVYKTKNGLDCKILHITDETITKYCIMAVIDGDYVRYTKDGKYYGPKQEDSLDLIPPTDTIFDLDELVMCKYNETSAWFPRHYATFAKGKHWAWNGGQSSKTCNIYLVTYAFIRKATKEEIEKSPEFVFPVSSFGD